MGISVSKRGVILNVVRVCDAASGQSFRLDGHAKVFKGLLNEKTGELRFAQRITSLPRAKGNEIRDWSEVEVRVTVERNKPSFELTKIDSGLGLSAKRIVEETLLVLNELARCSAKQTIEVDVSQIQLGVPMGEIEHLAGWRGRLGRIAAEEYLQDTPIGTYLLREDPDETSDMISQLAEANHTQLRAYLCTFVEEEGKITDLLILQSARGWTIRADSQDLSDRELYTYFGSPQSLIESLSSRLARPV